MNEKEIDESILDERYNLLMKCVDQFIKKMQKNGMAKRLQYYRAFPSFDAGQILDLFDEMLTEQREKYIFNIHQEIDHLDYLINQNKIKYNRREKENLKSTKGIRERNEHTASIYNKFNDRLTALKKEQEISEKLYIKKINETQKCIEEVKNMKKAQRIVIRKTRHHLFEIRDDFSSDVSAYYEIMNAYFVRFNNQIGKRMEQVVYNNKHLKNDEIYKLENELEQLRNNSQELSFAINNIFEYLKSISAIEAGSIENLIAQIPVFITELQEGVVTKYLSDSHCKLPGILLTGDKFIPSIKIALDRALDKREKQFESLESFGRKKRLNLQNELDKTLDKINKMSIPEKERKLFDDLNLSNLTFNESKSQLDETIKILSTSPFLSKNRSNID
ncbi:hypothetical protein TRFO_10572 [Tritrichomonas foetus]|uniref:Uncharacterized protein n=1 Tax=Tritrichomonas foetus TaxID=1144522 RepID=A0A1J4J9S1_9EUKA|nr:hypothetical protein TRFO_10572 [Tritrichomonas foetus]|eukprot:OHS95417.1 hypothetical protein TRFO_10572 [Tritrichomonas foetus]